jgi:hypothetical protein
MPPAHLHQPVQQQQNHAKDEVRKRKLAPRDIANS